MGKKEKTTRKEPARRKQSKKDGEFRKDKGEDGRGGGRGKK
jgi:hypothetical protein